MERGNPLYWLIVLVVLLVALVILFKYILPIIVGDDADTAFLLLSPLAGRVVVRATTKEV